MSFNIKLLSRTIKIISLKKQINEITDGFIYVGNDKSEMPIVGRISGELDDFSWPLFKLENGSGNY